MARIRNEYEHRKRNYSARLQLIKCGNEEIQQWQLVLDLSFRKLKKTFFRIKQVMKKCKCHFMSTFVIATFPNLTQSVSLTICKIRMVYILIFDTPNMRKCFDS